MHCCHSLHSAVHCSVAGASVDDVLRGTSGPSKVMFDGQSLT